MSVSSFPLHRLPFVALNDVINHMEPLEVLTLAQTSEKSKSLMKSATKRFPLKIVLTAVWTDISLAFGFNGRMSKLKIEILRTKPTDVNSSHCLIIYGKGKIEEITNAIDLLVDNFNAKSISFNFENQGKTFVKPIIDCAKLAKLKIEDIRLTGNCLNDEGYKLILEESRQASNLHLSFSSCTLKYNNFEKFNLDSVIVDGAFWITLKNLYSFMDCKSIHLSFLILSTQELNSFLEKWKLEESKLKNIEFFLSNTIDLSTAVQGLDAEMVKEREMHNKGIRKFEPGQCYNIQRKDGVTAIVTYENRRFILKTEK